MSKNKEESLNLFFSETVKEIMRVYHDRMDDFLQSNNCFETFSEDKNRTSTTENLTVEDVYTLILNYIVSISCNTYFSLKKYIDESQLNKMDFNLQRTALVVQIAENFRKIEYKLLNKEEIEFTNDKSNSTTH